MSKDSSMAASASVKRQRRHRHTAKDWEDIKPKFIQFYIEQDKALESVVETLKSSYDFDAR